MKNKAQMSSSFNYIFALIIGGIVFMFFVGFAYQYLNFAGSVSAAELVSSLNDEFAAFSASDSAEKTLSFSQGASFRVYEGKLMSEGQSKTIDHVIFAPFEVEGEDILLATKSLDIPYRIGNIFYIADGTTMYILVYDASTEDVVQELQSSYNSLPQNFPVEVVSTTQIASDLETLYELTASYEKVRFVFFSSSEDYAEDIAAVFSSYEILEVSSSLEDYSSGEVLYPNGEGVVYIQYPLLIGAIVSGDAYSYNYNFQNVLEKLARVTGVYYDKTKLVATRLPNCDYASIKTALNNFKTAAGDVEGMRYASFLAKMELVENANKGLGGECPEIY
ncbi:MAG: hypothetical protein Q8R18_01865 [bacterium]|nr:hypothetical protein [bacterium]